MTDYQNPYIWKGSNGLRHVWKLDERTRTHLILQQRAFQADVHAIRLWCRCSNTECNNDMMMTDWFKKHDEFPGELILSYH